MSPAKWASALSTRTGTDDALAEATADLERQLDGCRPALVVAFVTPHHAAVYRELPGRISASLGGLVLGCSAGGVIGGGCEVEESPGLSLTAAVLPGVAITPFSLTAADIAELGSDGAAWYQRIKVSSADRPKFLLLPDPYSTDAEELVAGMDAAYPGSLKLGGLASGGREPDANVLYVDSRVQRRGVVGVAMSGEIEVASLVAQGCRPVGEPVFVTRSDGNVVKELDGRLPVEVLSELYQSLPPQEQELMRYSLFLGIMMEAPRDRYERGDFLVRNIIGVDRKTGALAVSAMLGENQAVQFHVRDKETSARDLERVLSGYRDACGGALPQGGLLFSCLGRGKEFYGQPGHDSSLVKRILGEIPLGGFFSNGEIGVVHGSTFLHGYTSSFGLFSSKG